ncbi:hypothetical protein [Diaphorobacter sp. HDW4A]|uniref:hypothetical protein n=1 Tax=Diaphorobacter sp. HDW4A TaxID=2714924 RepID=UPI001F113B67|nr:hypothetical protein [Diaphorobacter sp. HDW4A]
MALRCEVGKLVIPWLTMVDSQLTTPRRAEMRTGFVQPAAIVAVEILRQRQHEHGEIDEKVIADAFALAYRGLVEGLMQINHGDQKQVKPR